MLVTLQKTNEELIKKYNNSISEEEKEKILEILIKKNTNFIYKIMYKVGRNSEDAFQFGCIGLIKAVKKFECDKGYRFTTYSFYWIKESITRGTGQDRAIRIPVWCFQDRKNFPAVTETEINDAVKDVRIEQMNLDDKILLVDFVKRFMAELQGVELIVFNNRILDNKVSVRAIAKKYKIKEKNISLIEKKLLNKLKNKSIKEGFRNEF